uniref:Beta-sandwich protein n=1 Tax=Pithovirus LCPAC201 TaxID=2506591 RepID=A0A481Z6V8_9VIRU|nr:MAG: beta-sandwich protein [Pithovirus LCPAC201]
MSIIVKVADKPPNHPFYGEGSKCGYTIDGHSGATLKLRRGGTYTLDIDTRGHPFYFTTDSTGAIGFPGSIMGNTSPVEVGRMTITIDDRFPRDQQIYYQCGVHPKMGSYVTIVEPRVTVKHGDIIRVRPNLRLTSN